MAVLADLRGQGIGAALMEAALVTLDGEGVSRVRLTAQDGKTGFYERFGFRATGPAEPEAGVPHTWMERTHAKLEGTA